MATTDPHLMMLTALLATDAQTSMLGIRHLQMLAMVCQVRDVPPTISEVSVRLGIPMPLASKMVSRLVDDGLIIKTRNPDNLQSRLLTPTQAGLDLDDKVKAKVSIVKRAEHNRSTTGS
jgi:DNA-binding MarR family transcriptional regulator